MVLPKEPVTLTIQQVEELNEHLSTLRHDVNGDLSLVVASAELLRLNPASAARMLQTLIEQPPKIRERLDKFSLEFEKMLGITRP